MLLIAQVTAVLEVPETVDVNWKELPARILAVAGERVIEVAAGVPGLLGLPPEPLLDLLEPAAAQPTVNSTAAMGKDLARPRMALSPHLGRDRPSSVSVSQTRGRGYWTKGKKKGKDRLEIVECRGRKSSSMS
jgi:hypothetical protein